MKRKFFGTDGIRGLANDSVMRPEIAFRLGAALTYQARQRLGRVPRIVVGKDTRISGYLFESAIACGVCAMGGRLLLSGPLPTPAVAHLTTSMRADVGMMISASHNAYEDNGIKVFGADGFKLPDDSEVELEALMYDACLDADRATGTDIGRAERLDDAPGRYVAFAKATFPKELTLDGLRIVVDAAHGAAYRTAPAVFEELGAEVIALGVQPNGTNINDEVGALHPQTACREVLQHNADIGISLDGDADRVVLIDHQGQVVDGDAVMALCAAHMLKKERLKQQTLVATVMSNLGLEIALKRRRGSLVRCDVGDRYVVEAMRRGGYNLGGEQSGHMVFLDYTTTGDGLVTALQVLAIMQAEERTLSELVNDAIEPVPQVLLNARFACKQSLDAMPLMAKARSSAETALGEEGRVLVRWSGTEPKLRVMVESAAGHDIQQLAQSIIDGAQQDLS